MNPDRIVIGAESDKARAVMRKLYQPLLERGLPYVETGLETAELTKYAANAFLATKITFINEIANLCEATGANVDDVAKGIGLDKRIGEAFLRTGPGFGGSCFPKDILAIAKTAQDYQRPLTIVESVLSANTARKTDMARKVVAACGGSVKGKTIAVLGLAFKADTDDMREAPALYILPELAKAGATLKAYDPQAMHEAKKMLPDLTYCATAADALTGADAAVVLTEWKEFRELDLTKAKSLMKGKAFIDLRNLFAPAAVAATGLSYTSLGRPTV
jgi:UDPglucose 6-dehydrogenase